MTTTPKELADRLRQGLTPLLKAAIGDLEAHYRDLRERELRKAEACQKCGDMHRPLEKCGEMADGKVKKEEPKMNPAPLKGRKVVPDQKAAPDAADKDSVLPTDKKSKDLTDKDTGSGGQLNSGKLEKIRKAAWSETKKAEMGSVPMAKPKKPTAAPASQVSPPVVKNAIPMSSPKIPGKSLSPEDHARALASQAAFTSAAVGEESRTQGAAGGELKAPEAPLPKKIKIPGRD
jgi:hypothetical protein